MVIEWKWLCEKFNIKGNAWFPLIAIVKDKNDKVVINHEEIHIQQQMELFYVGFILLYLFYHWKYGYDNNPFEVECNENERDLSYIHKRLRYSWIK